MENKKQNPVIIWEKLGNKHNWMDYILPKRTTEQFWQEGEEEAKKINEFITHRDMVIDYGCGIGRITKPMQKYCPNIMGLDICDKFVEEAKRNGVEAVNITHKKHFGPVASFIYCISVIQHNDQPNREAIVKSIYGLLKPGGKCFISFPVVGEFYRETPFVHVFDESEIRELLKRFKRLKLVPGNLVRYGGRKPKEDNEIFAIATK